MSRHEPRNICVFMLTLDRTCNYTHLQVFRNLQKPAIQAGNRFQHDKKGIGIIPPCVLECLGSLTFRDIWPSEGLFFTNVLLTSKNLSGNNKPDSNSETSHLQSRTILHDQSLHPSSRRSSLNVVVIKEIFKICSKKR